MKSQDSKLNISQTGINNQQSTINSSNTGTLPSQGPNWSKIQALKQRKSDLEKLLAEKTSVLQQIEKQEAKILAAANHNELNIENFAYTSGSDRNLGHNDDVCNGILRNKVDANFRLSKKLSSKDQGDVERLILEMKMLQEVCNTSYKMTNDPNITKSVRRVHQEELEQAQAKLAAINQTLELLRKRQMAHIKSGNHIQPQQFTQNTFPTTSHGSSVITLNLTKSPPVPSGDVHYKTNGFKLSDNENLCNISNNMLSSKKYGSSSNLTTYPISERRNSTRSMTRNVVKKIDDHMHLDGISLSNRNDYNENRYTIMHCNGTEHLNSYIPFDSPTGYGDYLYMAPRQKVVDFENQSSPNQYHQHHGVSSRTLYTDTNQKPSPQNSTPKPKMQLVEGPYPNDNKFYCSPQHAFDDSAIVKSLMTKHGMRQSYNFGGFHPNCFFDDNLVVLSDRTSKSMNMNINSTPPSASHLNSLRKHQRNALDLVSLSPTVASSFEDQPTLGLGGYWKTLSNNERVWCVVDNNFDNTTVKHGRVKKPAMQPTKSSSLGNFESISAGDEMGDKVSISSMNSETNKKPREKQWVETSLDGPAVKVKQSLSENDTKTMPLYSYVPKNHTVQNHLQMNTLPTHHRQNPISPHNSSHDIGQSLISHPHKHQTSRERPKLSSHSMSNYRPPLQQVETPDNMLLSLSISTGDQFKNSPIHQAIEDRTLYLHSNQNELLQQSPVMYPSSKSQSEHQQFHQIELNASNGHDFLPHPSFTNQQNSPSKLSLVLPPIAGIHSNNNNFDTLRSNRSPITPNLSKVPDIRVESPKNMTVIQQATFMPYKEETKPFEMSDFYKYSTKFRQKDQKQLVSAGTVNASINMEQTCKSNA